MFRPKIEAEIIKDYERAAGFYADYGVDAEAAVAALEDKAISLHCWQGDDVRGFESKGGGKGGGIMATGEFPGRARNADELRSDIDKVFSLVPGKRRVNLHAMYLEDGGRAADRDEIVPEHFEGWIQ